MNEWGAFDRELAESMGELPPPDGTVRTVTSWRDAMDRIVLGLCLTCFTLNFLYLQYLLPAIGTVQLYLGFRALRKNNRWFQIGWIISICKAILLYMTFVLHATPYSDTLLTPCTALQTALTILLFISLWQALRQADAELGQDIGYDILHDPLLWAMVWYLVIIVLAIFWPRPGWFVFLCIIFAFFRIIKSLTLTIDAFAQFGYAVQAAPVKVSTGWLKFIYYGSLLALIAVFSLLSNHVVVSGTPIEQNFESSETIAVRDHLLDLGFPEDLLSCLPCEELDRLTEATACVTLPNDPNGPWDTEIDGAPLITSGTMVYLKNGFARFYVSAKYSDESSIPWQNLAEIGNISHWDAACYLAYQENGIPCRATAFAEEWNNMLDTFFPSVTSPSISAVRYGFPLNVQDRTCVLAFTTQLFERGSEKPGWTVYHQDILVNFYHQKRGFRYPYQPLSSNWDSDKYILNQYYRYFEISLD